MTEIKRLSYSMLRAWLDCPRYFEFRYVRKLPAVLDGRLLAGRVYHHGVAYALRRKKQGELVTPDEVKDIMSDRWQYELGERVYYEHLEEPEVEARQINWGSDDPGKLKDTVLKLATLYLRIMVPKLQPVAVEERLEGVIGGVPFVGYPDLVLQGPGVVDHKLATRRTNQEAADKDLQFSAYAALIGRPIWAAFHQALDQKKPDINVVLTERRQGDIDWFAHLVVGVWKGIIAGVFPPNPMCWRCGSKCPYEIECRVLMEA